MRLKIGSIVLHSRGLDKDNLKRRNMLSFHFFQTLFMLYTTKAIVLLGHVLEMVDSFEEEYREEYESMGHNEDEEEYWEALRRGLQENAGI